MSDSRQNTDVSDLAEKVVLHGIMRDNTLYDDVVGICSAEDFRGKAHQEIYKAIGRLISTGKQADPAAIFESAAQAGFAHDVAAPYLLDLWSQWTSHDVVTHAGFVRDKATARRLRRIGEEILFQSDQHTDVTEQLDKAERAILGITETGRRVQLVSAAEAGKESMRLLGERIDRYERKEVSGVASGLPRLDAITGGFQPAEVAVVAARTSVGKTVFGLNVAVNACQAGVATAFVALEQSRSELFMRIWSSVATVDSWRIRRGCLHPQELAKIAAAEAATSKWPLFILDEPSQSVSQIASIGRRLKRRHNLGLIVIDYIGLIAPEDRRAPRQEQVSMIMRQIKHLARELRLPIMLLCQLNREAEKEEPKLSHLRESGSIEQDADTVILLHRDTDPTDNEWCDVKVRVAKQRNGPTDLLVVQMHKPTFRFIDKKDF